MRIVVTGSQGQLARSLAAMNCEDEIICVGRPALDFERPEGIGPAITELAPDVVVNAAAYTAVDLAESEPEKAMAANATGAGLVAKAAAAVGAPVIQISTDYVFDGKSQRPYREDDPTSPLGVYGASKLEGEKLAQAANPHCVVLRTAWVYSPYGKNFVRTMLRLAETREELGVVADQIGSPTSAPSLAQTVLAVARNLARSPDDASLLGVFHAVDGGEAKLGRIRSGDFRKVEGRRRPCRAREEDHDQRVSDACGAAGEFAARHCEARTRARRRAAALAGRTWLVRRSVDRAAKDGRGLSDEGG